MALSKNRTISNTMTMLFHALIGVWIFTTPPCAADALRGSTHTAEISEAAADDTTQSQVRRHMALNETRYINSGMNATGCVTQGGITGNATLGIQGFAFDFQGGDHNIANIALLPNDRNSTSLKMCYADLSPLQGDDKYDFKFVGLPLPNETIYKRYDYIQPNCYNWSTADIPNNFGTEYIPVLHGFNISWNFDLPINKVSVGVSKECCTRLIVDMCIGDASGKPHVFYYDLSVAFVPRRLVTPNSRWWPSKASGSGANSVQSAIFGMGSPDKIMISRFSFNFQKAANCKLDRMKVDVSSGQLNVTYASRLGNYPFDYSVELYELL